MERIALNRYVRNKFVRKIDIIRNQRKYGISE